MSVTLAAMLAEPSTIKLGLMFLVILAIAVLSVAALGLLAWFLTKLGVAKSSAAAPKQEPRTQFVPRQCPQCGAQLKPDAPEGLCPACLLQRGIATEGGAPPSSKPFTPPPIAELVKLFPQLEILEVIGQGGMGAVYKARQPALDRCVALKILTPRSGGDLDFAGRFTREARALARLSHPNIVGVYDFGQVKRPSAPPEAAGEPQEPAMLNYFIMEYVDGPNLRQVEQAGKLTPREALQIIPQICAALQFAHDEGIVHRDIKPENVLLDKKGRVKIADFGLAKILGQQADLRLTGARDVMGTPHYMAPEQVEKPQEVDHRADIYSLGVVFYEMLTGELPLGKFDPPSHKVHVDVRLDDVVLRSLAKSPERRYQHVSEIKTEVEHIVQKPSEVPLPPAGNPSPWSQGIDYRSKQTLFGLPLLHITSGIDPLTGKVRISKGVIAIGGRAQGVIAVGGLAMGGLAIGGLAVGAVALGGAAVGFLSFGGLALALIFALGGGAIAPIAMGGAVVGYMALGGGGVGAHVLAGNVQDPLAQQFFRHWGHVLLNQMQWINAIIVVVAIGLGVGLPMWIRKRIQSPQTSGILARIESWLAMMDAGNYGGSWENAASYFQQVVSCGEWVSKLEKARKPLGAVVSRRFRCGSFTANGTRFEARFDTDFHGLQAAVETVTFALQSNGDWRAIGYLVKPVSADTLRLWLLLIVAVILLIGFFVCLAFASQFHHQQALVPLTVMGVCLAGLIICVSYWVKAALTANSRGWLALGMITALSAVVACTMLFSAVKAHLRSEKNISASASPQEKIITLTRPADEAVDSSNTVHNVSVWCETKLEPDETVSAWVKEGTNEMHPASVMRFVNWQPAKEGSVTVLNWFFGGAIQPGFGETEAETACAQLRGNIVGHPLSLVPGEPFELFAITNQAGVGLVGYVEYNRIKSTPPPGTNVQAVVQIERVAPFFSWDMDYSATIPAGYALRATANRGSANSFTPAGPYQYHSSWRTLPGMERPIQPPVKPGQHTPFPRMYFESPAQRNAEQKEFQAQLHSLKDHGSFAVLLGQPKLLFSVTNGIGEVFQGFLELIGGGTNETAHEAFTVDVPTNAVTEESSTGSGAVATDVLAALKARRQPELSETSAAGADTLTRLMAMRQQDWPQGFSPEEQVALMEQQRRQMSEIAPKPVLPPPAPPRAKGPVTLAEQPPVVVETFPASGAREVEPGITEVRVRFSKPMKDGSWSWSTAWENSAPESIGSPRYLDDGRTCVIKVRLEPGKTYAWWLNSDKFKNFQDRAGVPAVPYLLTFQTQK